MSTNDQKSTVIGAVASFPERSAALDALAHSVGCPEENRVIERLAANWELRATVKRRRHQGDVFEDPERPDYPEELLPFGEHSTYRALASECRNRLLAWAWIAFNKTVMDIEQHVVNPGFSLLADGAFDTGMGDAATAAVVQAIVDEQYHTLLHFEANRALRRSRGWAMPETSLPLAYKARRYRERIGRSEGQWQRELNALAYTTAAEISVNSYLELVANNERIQPLHRATASLHSRDEYCHAQIAAEIAKATYGRLGEERRRFFLDALTDGMEAFAANDFATWYCIVDLVGVPGGHDMIADVERDPRRKRLFQDFRGLRNLCREMDVLNELRFDWSSVTFE